MGNISTCDNCTLVIKDGEEKYKLLIQKDTGINDAKNLEEMSRRYNESYGSTKYKEICGTCKKILDYLFDMRKDKMQKILKEIEKSYNPQKQCQCASYEDRGFIIYGIDDGICYFCEKPYKLEKPLSTEELEKLIEKEEGDANEKV